MIAYLVSMYVVSLALGYVLVFTSTTLAMGKALSDAATPTGYQDAITPPRLGTLAIAVYILTLSGILYGFWQFGWLVGLGILASFFITVAINQVIILPKSGSKHFRDIILHSMVNRHADYVKSGDTLRAAAMAHLLEKSGIPVNEFCQRLGVHSSNPD